MDCIRLLVADDHRLFRQGLLSLLQSEPEFEVVGEAASGQEALRLAAVAQPDVALVDLMMPDMSGTEVIAQLVARWPAFKVVVLTASEDSQDLLGAIQAGAKGYVLKNADADDLFDVIRDVYAGGEAICAMATSKVMQILRGLVARSAPDPGLTPREREVVALLAAGADSAEIASRLVISKNTVRTHVAHILEKLQLRNRSELIAWGQRNLVRD
jgi:DNA-binding NarL/FixJ family response regulator